MELISSLANKKIFLDSSPIIYYIEDHPVYAKLIDEIIEKFESSLVLSTSVITITDVFVKPIFENQINYYKLYTQLLLNNKNIAVYSINSEIALLATKLRAEKKLKELKELI